MPSRVTSLARGTTHMRLSTALDRFLAEPRARATRDAYHRALWPLIPLAVKRGAGDRVRSLGVALVRDWVEWLTRQEVRNLCLYRSALRSFIRYGLHHQRRWWAENPLDELAQLAQAATSQPARRARGPRIGRPASPAWPERSDP